MADVTFRCDPEGESVDLVIDEGTGLTRPLVVTLPTSEVGRIYNTLRASQLGADGSGNL